MSTSFSYTMSAVELLGDHWGFRLSPDPEVIGISAGSSEGSATASSIHATR